MRRMSHGCTDISRTEDRHQWWRLRAVVAGTASLPQASTAPNRPSCTASTSRALTWAEQTEQYCTYPAPLYPPPLQSVFNGLILVPSQPPLQARREYTALIHKRRCTYCVLRWRAIISTQLTSTQPPVLYIVTPRSLDSRAASPVCPPSAAQLAILRHASAPD